MNQARFALCDWGTTSFRLWLVDDAGEVINTYRSDEGLEKASVQGFSQTLEACLEQLSAPNDLKVMMCGMVGARQGWLEAKYVSVPANLSDILRGSVQIAETKREISILPGLSQLSGGANVMRGEETQLLGALQCSELKNGWVVMPGTHCKWVRIEEGCAMQFETFLTGETFSLFSKNSILRHSLGSTTSFSSDNIHFNLAVEKMLNGGSLLGSLFSVRAENILNGRNAEDSAASLSGMLIGSEIAGVLAANPAGDVSLVATGSTCELYLKALKTAGITVTVIDADVAVRRGLYLAASSQWPEKE